MNMLSPETPVALNAALKIWPVILSGGSGSRLWPLSRASYPKQLLSLLPPHTMLQATALRATPGDVFQSPVVVAGEDHRFLIREQLAYAKADAAAIILEPEGRNTAPAIALAALWLEAHDPDAPMLVMPSDHVVTQQAEFQQAIAFAAPAARAGKIVTFGIRPESPETGYGYIHMGDALDAMPGNRQVRGFVEKPDLATAQAYVSSRAYAWNSGIFMFTPRTYLTELAVHAPAIAEAVRAAFEAAKIDGVFVRPDTASFQNSPNISIDYAIAERSERMCVVQVSMGWSDVGSWEALWQIGDKNEAGNVAAGDVVAIDTSNSLMRVEGGPTIAALGLEDMVVVSTRDAVLVAPRSRAQEVKAVVDRLKADGRSEVVFHAIVHRPWGSYQTTDLGDRFQTKRIVVKPGQKLSLQMHHHRSEHWIVVSGTAKVVVGTEEVLLQENQSTYIPAGTSHRLENPGKIPLHLIEVQCGPYLGEDDIVRFEDSYGRA
jgi:mannose-1-phosphate guanylyltransferase / mannose-6-phosphate isomerase